MLEPEQVDAFYSDGYLVIENVISPEILSRVRAEYQANMDGLNSEWRLEDRFGGLSFSEQVEEAYSLGLEWFQPMDISLPGDRIKPDTAMHFGPATFEMLTSATLLDLVEDLIGPELTSCPIQHVRIKPPERQLEADELRAHVGGTDWHQDRAVALEEADQTDMVTIWIAITDATQENGCLQVLPHQADRMLSHCPQKQTAIAPGQVDTSRALPLPVPAGGILALHPLLPQASLPNRSDSIRWSFDIRFSRTGQPTGRSHFPDFVARSRAAPEQELRDWKAWRQMWIDARARLSEAPHIEQHRWQADSPACA